MAVEFKDYYKALAISRTASAEEIRKAFRKLARQYHPDVAKNKAQSEIRFKEINEAYEVLSDPEKRTRYDKFGGDWKEGTKFRPPPGWESRRTAQRSGPKNGKFEDHFEGTGFSDFFEHLFGSIRRGGAGSSPRSSGSPTGGAAGRGQDTEADILVSLEEVLRGAVRPITLQRTLGCQKCHEHGEVMGRICQACAGRGRTSSAENYQIKIPAGVREGQRLRLPGRGDPGKGGAAAGDLFLRVHLAKHPDFRVEESNLLYELEVAPWDAVLGTNASIPTLDGPVNIKIRSPAHGMRDKPSELASAKAGSGLLL